MTDVTNNTAQFAPVQRTTREIIKDGVATVVATVNDATTVAVGAVRGGFASLTGFESPAYVKAVVKTTLDTRVASRDAVATKQLEVRIAKRKYLEEIKAVKAAAAVKLGTLSENENSTVAKLYAEEQRALREAKANHQAARQAHAEKHSSTKAGIIAETKEAAAARWAAFNVPGAKHYPGIIAQVPVLLQKIVDTIKADRAQVKALATERRATIAKLSADAGSSINEAYAEVAQFKATLPEFKNPALASAFNAKAEKLANQLRGSVWRKTAAGLVGNVAGTIANTEGKVIGTHVGTTGAVALTALEAVPAAANTLVVNRVNDAGYVAKATFEGTKAIGSIVGIEAVGGAKVISNLVERVATKPKYQRHSPNFETLAS